MLISLLLAGHHTPAYVHSLSREYLLVDEDAIWSIPFHHDGQWFLASAAGGDLQLATLDTADMSLYDRRLMTDRTDLIDHSFRRCPSGGFLWLSQTPDTEHNPAWLLGDDLSIQQPLSIPTGDPPRTQNDGLALCTAGLKGFGFAEATGEDDYIYPLRDGTVQDRVTLTSSPRLTGAGMVPDPTHPDRFHISGFEAGRALVIVTYDTDLTLHNRVEVALPLPQEFLFYWPTGFLSVGGGYLVLSMGRDASQSWYQDQGNLYLWILDADFQLVDWMQVTNYAPLTDAAMRPWLAIHDDELLIAADRAEHPVLFRATVDLKAMASLARPSDTGAPPDTATPTDTGAPPDTAPPVGNDTDAVQDVRPPTDSPPSRCGCQGMAAALPALLPLLWVAGRRRRGECQGAQGRSGTGWPRSRPASRADR